jgi:hypothetical protein
MKPKHKSGDAWVRIASSVQAWVVVNWEDPQRLEPIRIPAHLIPINAPPAETARWKRCVPRLALINSMDFKWLLFAQPSVKVSRVHLII